MPRARQPRPAAVDRQLAAVDGPDSRWERVRERLRKSRSTRLRAQARGLLAKRLDELGPDPAKRSDQLRAVVRLIELLGARADVRADCLRLARHPAEEVRVAALEVLLRSRSTDPDVREVLLAGLRDGSGRVIDAVLSDLPAYGNYEFARAELRRLAADRRLDRQRTKALCLLSKLRPPDDAVLPLGRAILRGEDSDLYGDVVATFLLSNLGGPEDVPRLCELLDQDCELGDQDSSSLTDLVS